MKLTVDSLFNDIKDLTQEQINQYVSFLGPSIFDDSRSWLPENVVKIAPVVIFSYPFIKKILSKKELIEAYWENESFEKEKIEDIEILNEIFLSGNQKVKIEIDNFVLSQALIVKNMDSKLEDAYYEFITEQQDGEVLEILTRSKYLREDEKTSLTKRLVEKYKKHSSFYSDSNFISKFLTEEEMIDILSAGDPEKTALRICSEVDWDASVKYIKEKCKDKHKNAYFLLLEMDRNTSVPIEDAEYLFDLINPEDQINIIEECNITVYNVIMKAFSLKDKELVFRNENPEPIDMIRNFYSRKDLIQINEYYSGNGLHLSKSLEKTLESDKVDPQDKIFIIKFFKEKIEEFQIYINDPYFKKLIDFSNYKQDYSESGFDDASDYQFISYIKFHFISLDSFKKNYEKRKSDDFNSSLADSLHTNAMRAELQTYFFDQLSEEERISYIKKFDNLNNDQIIATYEIWKAKGLSKFVLNESQISLLKSKFSELDENESASMLMENLSLNMDKEDVILLLKKIEGNKPLFNDFMKNNKRFLIVKGFLDEYLFDKYVMSEDINEFMAAKIIRSDLFSLVKKEDYKKLEQGLISVTDNVDEKELSRVAAIIENSSNPSLMENNIKNNTLALFLANKIYFKNQTVGTRIDEEYVVDAFIYLSHYVESIDFTKNISILKNPTAIEYFGDKITGLLASTNLVIFENQTLLFQLVNSRKSEMNAYFRNAATLESGLEKLVELVNNKDFIRIYNDADLYKNILSKTGVKFIKDSTMMSHILHHNLINVEELVAVADSKEDIDHLYSVIINDQIKRKMIRIIRSTKKNLLPDDYITGIDLLEADRSWEFYINGAESVKGMANSHREVYFKNLNNSFDADSRIFNENLLAFFTFSKNVLGQIVHSISPAKLYDVLNSGIREEDSINKEVLLELLNEDRSLISKLEIGCYVNFYIDLYKEGITDVFKYANLHESDFKDSDLVDLLNETEDSFLLSQYKKVWKNLNVYEDFSAKISKLLAADVTKEDITSNTVSIEKNVITFKIASIVLVKAAYSKKENKVSYVSGCRRDLYKDVKSFFLKTNEELPEKVYGHVDLEGTFHPKEEVSYTNWSLSSEDEERLNYMKELGFEGNINAVALRKRNFTYGLEILFEQKTTISAKAIEMEVKKKTFDVSQKLKELLKVNPKRTFGFELELISLGDRRDEIARKLRKKGFDIDVSYSYGKSKGKTWDFKQDTSLRSEHYSEVYNDETGDYEDSEDNDAFEIASPILYGKDGINQAKKFLKDLFSGFNIESGQDLNAGLHVHHDIKDIKELELNSEDILKAYLPFQETLYSLIEDWRSESEYCTKISPDNIDEGRINGGATGVLFTDFGTMEFRMKEGLTSSQDILNWIIYTQNIVDLMHIKLTDKITKYKTKIDKVSEVSMFMLLENSSYGNYDKNKIKAFRKMVGFQESLYAES